MEKESVFLVCILVATAIDKAILLSEVGFERQGGFALVINVFYSLAHHANERLAHLHTANMHSHAMSLHHGSFAVAVDYETWQVVALAMHQTIGVVVGIVGNAKAAANLKSRSKTSCPEVVVDFNISKEEEVRGKISKLRDAIVVFADLIKVELGKNEQRSKLLVDAVKQMRQENDVSSKALQDKLEVMNNSPQKKLVTHRFEPTSKYVLLFIGGLALSLVISIWGNLTQWREHQDWEEADLKYRALKMVLSADDPNILYIEKHFSVNRDENVIDYVKNRVAAYEDSVLKYNEMVRMAAYKDSVANELRRESNSIKRTIKNYQ